MSTSGTRRLPSHRPPCGAGGVHPPPPSLPAGAPGAPWTTRCPPLSGRTGPGPARTPPADRRPAGPAAGRRRSPGPPGRAGAAGPGERPCPHHQLPRPPVDVIQPQARHLTCAQPQPKQRDEHRVVAPSQCRAPVTAIQQRPPLGPGDPRGQRRAPSAGHRKHRPRQIGRHLALDEQKRRNDRSPATKNCVALTDTAADSRSTPGSHLWRSGRPGRCRRQLIQEPAGMAHVTADSARRQSSLSGGSAAVPHRGADLRDGRLPQHADTGVDADLVNRHAATASARAARAPRRPSAAASLSSGHS